MALREIEHKFLVRTESLPPLPTGVSIQQGYLSRKPIVRVRIISDGSAFLTVKGKGKRARDEFEYKIPVAQALTMLKLCGKRRLSKVRYRLGRWELDRFTGKNAGLWLAEIELPSEKSRLPKLPSWIGREVTYVHKYGNANLACR